MGIMWKRLPLFCTRAVVLVLVSLVIFSASPLAGKVEADGWGGWDAIDTIYYDPAQEDPNNNFLGQAATEIRDGLQKAGKTLTITTASRPASGGIYIEVNPSHSEFTDRNEEAFKLYSDADGIYITGKTPFAVRHGAYTL